MIIMPSPFVIPLRSKGTASVVFAASDSPASAKRCADFILPGSADEVLINSEIVRLNTLGGGKIVLLDGTYSIWSRIYIPTGSANILLEGESLDTVLNRQEISGTAVGTPSTTLTATAGIFTSAMAADGSAVQFDVSGNMYDITGYTSATEVTLASDASAEGAAATFKIANIYHIIHQSGEGNHIYIRNLKVDNLNFGDNDLATNKGIFLNGNVDDWTLCHHIGVEDCWVQNSGSEAICIDYAQYAHIRNCRTYHSGWAGATLAQVRFGDISDNYIEESGYAGTTSGMLTQGHGVNMQACTHCIAQRNVIDHPRCNGIAVYQFTTSPYTDWYGAGYNKVIDNHILRDEHITVPMTGGASIHVSGAGASSPVENTIVSGNVITRNLEIGNGGTWKTVSGLSAISVRYARNTSILNNVCTGFGNTGIRIWADAIQTYHHGNYVGAEYVNKIYSTSSVDTTAGTDFDLSASVRAFAASAQLQPSMSGAKVVTNTGATGTIQITLPRAIPGLIFTFTVVETQYLRVNPYDTETLAKTVGGGQEAAGKYCQSTTAGHSITLLCETAGQWECKALTGTFTAEP